MTKKAQLASVTGYTAAKIISNNTIRINYEDGRQAIRLHNTDIITTHPDGSTELNSGGWRTHTTKARINEYSPLKIRQRGGCWYVAYTPDQEIPFFDGIKFDPDRVLIGKIPADPAGNVARIKKQIKKYLDGLDKIETLPEPNNGDCWHCLLKEEKTGRTWGDLSRDQDHLKQHLKDGYIHGSIILNALKEAGYRCPEIFWTAEKSGARPSIKRALRRYLLKRLAAVAV